MTKEDAIYEIKQLAVLSNEKDIERITKALEMAIEALHIDIVRCKECVKRMRGDCPMCNGCKLDRVPTEDDDFCSYGERKSDE